ncbi:hypothetical protein NE865_07083 [Phthorimaea operculella]|nr:hypothetical protein NE865_07083 [Phthorimaea operculella]
MNRKPEKVPKSALSLYVKLYCKRKGGTDTKYHSNLIEATKSWLSLSKEEKQQFAKKLEECKVKYKHRFADYLKNAQPYLKKKPIQRSPELNSIDETIAPVNDIIEPNEDENQVDTQAAQAENNTLLEIDKSCWIESFAETQAPEHQEIIAEEETITDPLPEPIPPSVKSAVELFNIVRTMNGQDDKSWETLTNQEKRRYRAAVLTLKKEYIKKYKAYLESLPSKMLFDYYNNKL